MSVEAAPRPAVPTSSPARRHRARRRRWGRTGYLSLKAAHAVLGAAWVGSTVAGLFVLTVVMNESTVVGATAALRLIDLLLYIPLNVLTLLTGVLFSVRTHWGFVTHGWVTVKYVINLTVILLAGVVLAPAMVVLDELTRRHGSAAWRMPAFQQARWLFVGMMTFFLALLVIASILPIVKPRIPIPLRGTVHRLRVVDAIQETHDARTFVLRVPALLRRRYRYHAGQYLTVVVDIDGRRLRRAYSLSSEPGEPHLTITLKRVAGGVVSNHLIDTVRTGARIRVEEPRGRFGAALDSAGPAALVLIGAGSGITPLFSLVKFVVRTQPGREVHLLYGNRTPGSTIFLRAVTDLAARYDRFHLTLVHSRIAGADPWPGLRGRITPALLHDYLHRRVVSGTAAAQYYLCGPDTLIDSAATALTAVGVSEGAIHREYFAAGGPAHSADVVTVRALLGTDDATVQTDRRTTITDALEAAGYAPPATCRSGSCSTCLARVLDGTTTMRRNYALSTDEVGEGLILTCQATPASSTVTVDFDDTR